VCEENVNATGMLRSPVSFIHESTGKDRMKNQPAAKVQSSAEIQ
jgi:hypothetical protein